MQRSQYCFIIPFREDFLVYNTLNGSLTVIDSEMYDVLMTGKGSPEIIEALSKQGLLIEDTGQEMNLIQASLEQKKWCLPSTGYRGSPLGRVAFLNFIVTHECNLNCRYCYRNSSACTGHMSKKVAERGVTFAENQIVRGIDTLFVSLYGGEPLLNQECITSLTETLQEACSEAGISLLIKLFTNGTLLTPEGLDNLSQFTVADIHITFDAPEYYHHTRRVFPDETSSLQSVVEGAQCVEDHGMNLIMRINVWEDNIITFLEMLREAGLEKAHTYFGTVTPRMDYCTHYYSSYGYPGTSDLFSEVMEMAAHKGFTTLPFGIGVYFSLCAGITDWFHIINVDGRVYKCMSLVGDTRHAVGSLNSRGSLDKTPAYYSWMARNPLAITECKACVMLPRCMGGCPAIALREKGTLDAPGCFTVDFTRQVFGLPQVKTYVSKQKEAHE
ncbi:MAG: SPASM domain-containing protein [Theionarchaea archaeon]|nr:SPASM domain-containing protein [Theionarchaea archaeon]MBU7036877.1 SPASM domain-containing protein [Theionarchaea archaeon]